MSLLHLPPNKTIHFCHQPCIFRFLVIHVVHEYSFISSLLKFSEWFTEEALLFKLWNTTLTRSFLGVWTTQFVGVDCLIELIILEFVSSPSFHPKIWKMVCISLIYCFLHKFPVSSKFAALDEEESLHPLGKLLCQFIPFLDALLFSTAVNLRTYWLWWLAWI